jgi:glyoxylase-like metal-dependent hydrolase (beta-lactamase superfamily II)
VIHEILQVGPLQCNCSILGDAESGEAMVIDPGADVEQILELVQRHGLRVTQIVVTHAHIDHVGGAMKLKERTGAPVLMNQNDHALLRMLDTQASWIGMAPPGEVKIDSSLSDGDHVRSGAIDVLVLHTPGHTEGSISLFAAEQQLLVAGDTLFAGSIGRTDLPGGSYDKIMSSLRGRLMQLPDETVVIPGHGPLTTIGAERETNPFIADNRGRRFL